MSERVIQVLFIEDNPADARLVQEKLIAARQVGWDLPYFEIEHVDRLQLGLTRLGEEGFDVVLSDLDLPDSRAEETVTALRAQIPQMPLVVLTGREDEALARKSVRAGVQDYLYKNEVTGSLLARTLMYAIERQQIHTELEARVAERTQALQQSNAALREREQRLHTIFEAAPVGITETDLEGRWLWVNRQFCEMVGYTRDELYTMAYQDLTHPDDLSLDDTRAQRALAGEIEGFSIKKRYRRKDGTFIWVKLMVTLVRDVTGEPECFTAVLQDITEQQQAEEVTAARLRIASASATHSSAELMQLALDEVEALTGSRIGFYHLLEEDQKTLALQAWSTRTLGTMCRAQAQRQHYPVSEAGVWVDCIKLRRPVIHNDYASLPHRKGLPAGHTPVVRELVVPIMRDERIVAIVGVGNKPTDYDAADMEIVSLLGDFSWEMVERKRVEEALRESETRFRTIVDVLPQFIAYTDKELKYRFVNRTYQEKFGLDPDEVLGRTVMEVIGEEAFQKARAHVEQALSGEQVRYHERYDYAIGGTRDIDGILVPDVAEDGEVQGYYAVLTDITPYMEIQKALQKKEIRYRQLLDTLQEGVWAIDTESRTTFANPKMAEMLGYTVEEMEGRGLFDFMDEAGVELAKAQLARRRQGVREEHEFLLLHKEGHHLQVLMKTAPILDSAGRYQGAIAGVMDITDRKRAERVTKARLRIAAASATNSSAELMQLALDEIEALTDSQIGFYHFLEEGGESVVLQSWSTHTLERMCRAQGPGLHYALSKAGVWADAIRERRPVIHNDYASLPHRKGLPPGHVPVVRELVVPIERDQRIVGVFGVGNKATEYDAVDLEIASQLGDFSWEIVTRRRMEEALAESEARFRLAVSHSGIIFAQTDRELRYTWISNPHPDFISQDALGKRDDELGYNEGLRQLMEMKEEVLDSGHKVRKDITFPVSDGLRTYDIIAEPLRDGTGEISGVATYALDITERKWAEAALRKSEQRLRAAQRLGRMGHWDFDLESGEITWSRTTYELYERDPQLGPPTFEEDMALHHPEDAARLQEVVQQAIQQVQPYEIDLRAPLPSGKTVCLHAIGAPITDVRGRVVRLEGTVQDITERKRAEQEIERYAARLERSNQELEEFAYVISHDLQEPVRTVKGFLDLLERRYAEGLDEQAKSFIDYAVDGAERMQEMIGALLDLSRVGTQGEPLIPIDVEAVLERALKMLDRSIAESGARVTHDPLPVVQGDGVQLAQVFQNLIANAIKFRRADEAPQVHVSATREGDLWRFSVADNGIGIPADQRERIFQIFHRLHTREEYPGTGIGLALCRRIVERHGGRIWVESEPGEGATFYFTLPA
jgi:PAS domain S-box-containing protein